MGVRRALEAAFPKLSATDQTRTAEGWPRTRPPHLPVPRCVIFSSPENSSTATHIMRTATRPVTIRGRGIGEGERVTLWNPSANRDHSLFTDPDRFDVRRQPNRHLALGSGEHFCLGGILARAELRLLYGELLRNVECVELAGAPVLLSSIVVNGPARLPVRLIPKRRPS